MWVRSSRAVHLKPRLQIAAAYKSPFGESVTACSLMEINFVKCGNGSSSSLAGEPSHRHVNNVFRDQWGPFTISVCFKSLALCGCARLTTAGYKGSLWCQPENGPLRQTGFYGVMLHFLNHTIKAWSGEKEIDRLVFTAQRAREREKEE